MWSKMLPLLFRRQWYAVKSLGVNKKGVRLTATLNLAVGRSGFKILEFTKWPHEQDIAKKATEAKPLQSPENLDIEIAVALDCSSSCGPPCGQCVFFCPKVKRCQRCQRIRVKSYQNVGFRSSIDYNFSRQPGLVTTHSHLGVFLDQTVKVGRQSIETNRPWRQAMWGPTGTANSVQRREKRIKTSGLRVLVDYVRPLRELTHFWTSTCGGTIYPAYGGKNEAVN